MTTIELILLNKSEIFAENLLTYRYRYDIIKIGRDDMMITTETGRWVTIGGRRVYISSDGEATIPAYFKAKRSRIKYEKHRKEFGNITLKEYVARAVSLSTKIEGVEQMKLTDGRHYKYDPKSNEFLLVENNRITTFFKPKLGKRYWEIQQNKYKELIVP